MNKLKWSTAWLFVIGVVCFIPALLYYIEPVVLTKIINVGTDVETTITLDGGWMAVHTSDLQIQGMTPGRSVEVPERKARLLPTGFHPMRASLVRVNSLPDMVVDIIGSPRLTELSVYDSNVSFEHLAGIVRKSPNLRLIVLGKCNASNQLLIDVSRLKQIQSVGVFDCDAVDKSTALQVAKGGVRVVFRGDGVTYQFENNDIRIITAL